VAALIRAGTGAANRRDRRWRGWCWRRCYVAGAQCLGKDAFPRACKGNLPPARILSVQNCYNLQDRSSEGLVDICASAKIAFIPWYPLAAGRLARPRSPLARIAQHHHATPSQIVLAWLLHRSPVMLPIPGTSSLTHSKRTSGRDLFV
jgi:aryl-alcohol dehydrogenase-like predicted oxidoreductase